MKNCENKDCKKCIIDIGIAFIGTIAIIYLVYIFTTVFFTAKNIDRSLNIGFNLSDSFWGAIVGGIITLMVMYFTTKAGKENVERTIQEDKIQQEKLAEDNIKRNVRQIILLYERQKEDIELGLEGWEKIMPLASNFMSVSSAELLNVLSGIPYIDKNDATEILGFNNAILLLNDKRERAYVIRGQLEIDRELDLWERASKTREPRTTEDRKNIYKDMENPVYRSIQMAQFQYGRNLFVANDKLKELNDIIARIDIE